MQFYGKTDTGKVRSTNQDAFVCGQLQDDAAFAVVCDGMGGANGGNIASAMAIKVISERLAEGYRAELSRNSLRNLMETALSAANIEIFDAAAADSDLRGMGTTAVAVIIKDGTVSVAHVGDSRAYQIDDSGILQITKDHSIVQDMVEKGQLTQSEAKNHPRKHFITRALGVEETVECDYNELPFPENGVFLLCTDGLTNMVEPDDIYKTVRGTAAEDAAGRLTAQANAAGGSDNITVVLITQ